MKTIVIIAPGRLLDAADVQKVIDAKIPILAVANVYNLAHNAAYCYAADGRWWDHHLDKIRASRFKGRLVTCEAITASKSIGSIQWLEHISNYSGSMLPPKGTVTGTSSGEHALIFAAATEGFDNIILLGYEYGAAGNGHYFGDHPRGVSAPSDWRTMCLDMGRTAARCANNGVRVVNCTEITALTCFQIGDLDAELEKAISRPAPARRTAQRDAVKNPAS